GRAWRAPDGGGIRGCRAGARRARSGAGDARRARPAVLSTAARRSRRPLRRHAGERCDRRARRLPWSRVLGRTGSERCVSPVETARLEIVYALAASRVRIPPSPLMHCWRREREVEASGETPEARTERCPSGRRGTPGERVYLHRYRGFESLPLRSACASVVAPLPCTARRGIGRWWLGPAQDGVANPARS